MEYFYQDEEIKIYEEEGIIKIIYDTRIITLEMVKKSVEQRLKLMNGRKMPVILYVEKTIKYCKKSAMEYTASKIGTDNIKAGAIVVKNRILEIISNFFLLLNPPTLPTFVTYNEERAYRWIQKYKEKDKYEELESCINKSLEK